MRGFWRLVGGGSLCLGSMLAIAGCDWLVSGLFPSPSKSSPPTTQAPLRSFRLSPDELMLNLPSDEPCPCPFEAAGSYTIEGGVPERPLVWSIADAEVATISASGRLAARATGTTIVTVLAEGWEPATASLRVVDRGGRAAVTLE